jgi:hypothetical protein
MMRKWLALSLSFLLLLLSACSGASTNAPKGDAKQETGAACPSS